MSDLKAIETVYRGYRMRSRLEARWAVVLNALGAQWTYEPEGFDLDGLRYLPDFWISDWNMYVEIKPDVEITDEARDKAGRLNEISGKQVLLIAGQPWHGEYKTLLWKVWDESGQFAPMGGWEFGNCRKCPAPWMGNECFGAFSLASCDCTHDKYPLIGDASDVVSAAFYKARSERFEQGERKAINDATPSQYELRLKDRIAWVFREAGPRNVKELSEELFALQESVNAVLQRNRSLFFKRSDGRWSACPEVARYTDPA